MGHMINEKAYAKLNLSLDVVKKRADGYHDMRMVMQTVSLYDDIGISLRDDGVISVSTNLRFLPCDERNIAYRAAKEFFLAIGKAELGADITIKKHIPVCAGMGGGSSNGAAVLRALNSALGKPMSAKQLETFSAVLGSDVPFCIRGGTALAEGRGEILNDVSPLGPCHIVICKPSFSVSTPVLFSKLDLVSVKYHPDTFGIISALESEDLDGVAKRMFNVFEGVLPKAMDSIETIKGALLDHGALGAVMTGTGSAVFGIFDSPEKARKASSWLKKRYRDVFIAIPQEKLTI